MVTPYFKKNTFCSHCFFHGGGGCFCGLCIWLCKFGTMMLSFSIHKVPFTVCTDKIFSLPINMSLRCPLITHLPSFIATVVLSILIKDIFHLSVTRMGNDFTISYWTLLVKTCFNHTHISAGSAVIFIYVYWMNMTSNIQHICTWILEYTTYHILNINPCIYTRKSKQKINY
mgnify:CR=1 FL=1